MKRLTAVACLALSLPACASQAGSTPDLTQSCAPHGRERPAGMPDGDYYNFIWHDGLLYSADFEQPPEPPPFADSLGEVTCRFSGSTTPLDYSASREGEAGFLDAGTPYFSVSGLPSSEVIGAMYQGRPLLSKAGLDS